MICLTFFSNHLNFIFSFSLLLSIEFSRYFDIYPMGFEKLCTNYRMLVFRYRSRYSNRIIFVFISVDIHLRIIFFVPQQMIASCVHHHVYVCVCFFFFTIFSAPNSYTRLPTAFSNCMNLSIFRAIFVQLRLE